jgi:hypothetical protein
MIIRPSQRLVTPGIHAQSSTTRGQLLDNVANVNAVYSVRRIRTYVGNLVRLRRDSDDAQLDFGYDINGALDSAAIASWLGVANGFLVTWYDQSGNGYNATQATAAAQPQYIASSFGSKPAFRFDSGDDYLSAGSSPSQSNAFTIAGVAATHTTGSFPMLVCYGDGAAEGWNLGWDSALGYREYLILKTTTGTWGSDHFPEMDNNPTVDQGYRILAYRNAAASAIRRNGAEVADTGTSSAMQYGASPAFVIGNRKDLGVCADRDIAELIYIAAAAAGAEMSAIDTSQSAYFGV